MYQTFKELTDENTDKKFCKILIKLTSRLSRYEWSDKDAICRKLEPIFEAYRVKEERTHKPTEGETTSQHTKKIFYEPVPSEA